MFHGVQKAFDKLWHDNLYKFVYIGLTRGLLVYLIASYLKDKWFTLKLGSVNQSFSTNNGWAPTNKVRFCLGCVFLGERKSNISSATFRNFHQTVTDVLIEPTDWACLWRSFVLNAKVIQQKIYRTNATKN